MKITISVNHNYYEEKPIEKWDLKRAFHHKRVRDIEGIFENVFELHTQSKLYKKLQVFGFKSNSKIDDEQKLVLKLYKKIIDGEVKYFVQTGLYAGIIFHNGCQFNITSKYGDAFFKRMLNFLNDIYLDDVTTPTSKDKNINEFQFIVAYLFMQSLERAAVLGLPKVYQTIKTRSHKVRGKIDLNAYLKNDIPFKGKLTTTYREQTYIQSIVDVLYVALLKIEKIFGKEVNQQLLGVKQILKQHYSGYFVSPQIIREAKNHRGLHNPMFSNFKKVLEYAEIIINSFDLNISPSSNTLETTGFLFDISELFEVYLEKLLRYHLKDWIVNAQTKLSLYKGLFYGRKMLPDLVLKHKTRKDIIVFDAKFKTMRLMKKDLDRSDFYQIHSYIQYYQPDVIFGGLIYPLSNKLNIEKAYSDKLFGHHHRTDTQFIVDGIYVNEKMNSQEIIKSEEAFIDRIKEMINLNE
jgi:5-methylcytosine-specific restriction enzyme subunit McrC